MNPTEIIQLYDEMASNYDERVFHEKDYSAYQKIPAWLLEFLTSEALSICDLGCGTGLGSRPLLARGHQVVGVDISPEMLKVASQLPFKSLICQNLESALPFPDAEFDAAQMIGVMEFIRQPEKLFREVYRILKAWGVFGFTVPKKLSAELEQELGILTFDLSEIASILSYVGFEMVREETFQGFIYKETTIFYFGLIVRKKQ